MRILLLVITLGIFAANGVAKDEPKRGSRMSLIEYLLRVGKSADCYFTLTTDEPDKNNIETIVNVPDEALPKNVDDAIKAIKMVVPRVSIERSENIVHIIDPSIAGANDPLRKRITLKWSGRLFDLPEEIGKKGARVRSERVLVAGDQAIDMTTMGRVDASDVAARDLLSNAVPLENYNRVIWVARLRKDGEQVLAYVSFRGSEKR